MKIQICTLLAIISTTLALSANAEYVMKVELDKSSINFKQYYDNVGVNPDEDNTTPSNAECKVTNTDLANFGGQLIKVSAKDGLKCVVDYIVPKATFSPDCTAEYLPISQSLTNALISKGVDGISSIGYFGECE